MLEVAQYEMGISWYKVHSDKLKTNEKPRALLNFENFCIKGFKESHENKTKFTYSSLILFNISLCKIRHLLEWIDRYKHWAYVSLQIVKEVYKPVLNAKKALQNEAQLSENRDNEKLLWIKSLLDETVIQPNRKKRIQI